MGERSGKLLLGLVLLIVGALLLLDLFGIGAGKLISLLVPVALMVYGARKVIRSDSRGGRVWGVFVFLVGLLALVGKLQLLFTSLLAIGIIYMGMRLLRRSRLDEPEVSLAERYWAQSVLKEDKLDAWERELGANRP